MRRLPPFRWGIVPFGITVGLGYELTAYFVGEVFPETRPLGFLVGAGLAVNTTYAEQILRQLRKDKPPAPVRKIAALLLELKDPWERKLATELVDVVRNVLGVMVRPTHSYNSEASLYRALTDEADLLRSGEELFAVCAHKTWNATYVRDYLDANIQATGKRGAFIRRIFYEFDANARHEAQRQANHGITTSLLRKKRIGELKPVHQIPDDLGIAIFRGETVFIHRGLGKDTRAYRYDCVQFAATVRSLFGAVEEMAERVQPAVPRSNAAKPAKERKTL